jgi:hypothetical protein
MVRNGIFFLSPKLTFTFAPAMKIVPTVKHIQVQGFRLTQHWFEYFIQ